MNTGPPPSASWAPERLFAYGSLVDPDCLREVLGHEHLGERLRAQLAGYQRLLCAAYSYPYIVEALGRVVDGVLLTNLTAYEMEMLDHYEEVGAGMYRRELVEVEAWACGPQSLRLRAHTYVAGPALLVSTNS
jgi:gamma-glutamylcyclotransferase (GGCT)/AIG2-like uncharacterized protein YtfP